MRHEPTLSFSSVAMYNRFVMDSSSRCWSHKYVQPQIYIHAQAHAHAHAATHNTQADIYKHTTHGQIYTNTQHKGTYIQTQREGEKLVTTVSGSVHVIHERSVLKLNKKRDESSKTAKCQQKLTRVASQISSAVNRVSLYWKSPLKKLTRMGMYEHMNQTSTQLNMKNKSAYFTTCNRVYWHKGICDFNMKITLYTVEHSWI